MSDLDLIGLLAGSNEWQARHARTVLQHRAQTGTLGGATRDELWKRLGEAVSLPVKLRHLWALWAAGGLDEAKSLELLENNEPYVRMWAVRALTDDRKLSDRAAGALLIRAERESSAVVRRELAVAMQRVPAEVCWQLFERLIRHGSDEGDRNIPRMLWFGIEPRVMSDPDRALGLAEVSEIPLPARCIARRLTAGNLLDQVVGALGRSVDRPVLRHMLAGVEAGFRDGTPMPSSWPAVYEKLSRHPERDVRTAALRLASRFGQESAIAQLVANVDDRSRDAGERIEMLRLLIEAKSEAAGDRLHHWLDDPALVRVVVRALAAMPREGSAARLIELYRSTVDGGLRDEIWQALAARKEFEAVLLEALANRTIPLESVPVWLKPQLLEREAFANLWRQPGREDRKQLWEKWQKLLGHDGLKGADAANGKAVFQQACAACHKMHGQGGDIGPDLTGSNRQDLDYLLQQVLWPSDDVGDAYKLVTLTLNDGRVIAGNILAEDPKEVTIKQVGGSERVPVEKIAKREVSQTSLMPPGILEALTPEQARDLVLYLRQP